MKCTLNHLLLLFPALLWTSDARGDGWNVEIAASLYRNWDHACAVAVSGDYAFVATGITGLRAVNIANPSSLSEVGWNDTLGNVYAVAVSGDDAYVATSACGFQVLDVSDPSNLVSVGSIPVPWTAWGIAVRDGYVLVGAGGDGLRILDLSDPVHPEEIGDLQGDWDVYSVELVEDFAYLACHDNILRIVEITEPSSPAIIAQLDIPGNLNDIFVDSSYAYLAAGPAGLRILDLENPVQPVEIGSYTALSQAASVVAYGDYAYLCGEAQGGSDCGIYALDVSNPSNPIATDFLTLPTAGAMTLSANTLYVADFYYGLRAVNVENPANLNETGAYFTPGLIEGVNISDDKAYVAYGDAGLHIVDIAAPTNPLEIGSLDTPGEAKSVAVSGSYAYVADGDSGLRIVNISDPGNLLEVGGIAFPPGSAYSVAVSGDFAYVAGGIWGDLRVINVADPTQPYQTGYYFYQALAVGAWKVLILDHYAYLADDEAGLRIIDISNPYDPVGVASLYEGFGGARSVAIQDGFAYVPDLCGKLKIADISDPLHPSGSSETLLNFTCTDIAVAGDNVFLTADQQGLYIFNVADPLNPYPVGSYDTKGVAVGVAVSGDYTVVADLFNLGIYDCQAALGIRSFGSPFVPAVPTLHPGYPNPFNAGTTIRYSLPYPAQVRLDILDAAGRNVITLINRGMPVGDHTAFWHAEGAAGGVYFCRLEVGNPMGRSASFRTHRQVQKIVLLK
jgi:hypothetical protein